MSKDEISVPRELLERLDFGKNTARSLAALPELRALLAQPNTCTKDGGQCGLGGYCEPCHSVEPAAWLVQATDEKGVVRRQTVATVQWSASNRDMDEWAGGYTVPNHPLYRHPSAQAPITMKQVFMAIEYANDHPHRYLNGTTNWCAAVAFDLNRQIANPTL